jgi:uncharacterized protein
MLNRFWRWFEHNQVYHPTRDWEGSPANLQLRFEDVSFAATDGVKLSGWFFPAPASSTRPDWTMLACHGNGGNISHRLGLYQTGLAMGFSVLAFDYRGYGRSDGRPGEEGTYCDAQGAARWLKQRGFAPQRLIIHGESLGGAVATELAVREPAGALIVQSSFTSIAAIGAEFFPWLPVRKLSKIGYHTHRKLPGIRIPVLVLHSRDDKLIPFHHGEENFAVANEPKLFRELHGGHNDPYWLDPVFKKSIEELQRLIEGQKIT